MKKRLYTAILLGILCSLFLAGIAHAADEEPPRPTWADVGAVQEGNGEDTALEIRRDDLADVRGELLTIRGQVQLVIPGRSSFIIRTRGGERVRIRVVDRTRFHSTDGSVEGIGDLERGMLVGVRGVRPRGDRAGGVVALHILVAAREDILSARGEIRRVEIGAERFELEKPDGSSLTVYVEERTRFISPGGEIESIADLEAGMVAGVWGVAKEDGSVLALRVAAGAEDEIRDHLVRAAGEITRVVPGQSTFWLLTREGQLLEVQVKGRTRFRSPDGSVQDIHDLKKGMVARVLAYETEGGELFGLRVWVRSTRERTTGELGPGDRFRGAQPDLGPSELESSD